MDLRRILCNVIIYYGGIFKLIPKSVYEGGSAETFEGIDVDVLNMEWLNSKGDECGIKKPRRFYSMFNKAFVLLGSDKTLDKFVKKSVKPGKNVCIYVEGEMEPIDECDQTFYDNVIQSDENRNAGAWNDDTESSDEESDYRSDEDFDSDCCSDVESEKSEKEKFKKGKKHYATEDYDPHFEQDMTFATRQHLKKAIQSLAIKSMRSLKLKKNEEKRLTAVCDVNGCPWKILSRKVPDEHTFKISSYIPKHTCCKTFKVKNLKSTWLVEKYISYFKTDPMRNLEAWRLDIIKEIGVDISWDQCYTTRKKALKILNGDPAEQFKKLWDYREELLRSNPGSTIILHNDDSTGELRFWGFYVCFAGSKEGFLSGCRKFIGLDGAHISGPHGGVLLTAVGNDPNNKPYLIAYAVVSTESGDTWGWFLRFLKDDLCIVSEEYTFMSDKQKGLINAVNEVFNGCEHRFCVRHLWKNMVAAGFKGDAYKDILFKASNATSIDVFKCAMKEMEELDPKAVEWLADKPPTQWSKSHFSTKNVCDMVLNNHCESYNNIVLKARTQPILVMLEWIREGMIKRRQKCRDKATLKWHETLTPKAMKILEYNMEKVKFCRILKVNNDHFQVTVNEFQYNVNFEDFSCTCRRWQLSGIPCSHALSAISHVSRCNPVEYVHAYYKVETFKNVYAPVIYGINGAGLWHETNFIPPLPPNNGRGSGRPKHDRRRAPDEPVKKVKNAGKRGPKPKKSRRMQTTLKCSYCHFIGHNVKTCQIKKAKELEEQQEQDLINSSEFANAFSHVVNSNVDSNPTYVNVQQQENLISLDEVTIIEPSYSSAICEDRTSANGSRQKLQIIKNKFMLNQESNIMERREINLPSSMSVLSSGQQATVRDEYIYQPQTTPITMMRGPSASEQNSQHLAGMSTSSSSVPGVVVGGKRFVQVSQLEDVMLKKRKK